MKEKDLTLAIANAVTSSLQANGISTVQTRTGDVVNAGTKLQWRLDIGKGADIYVSIHINASTSAQPNGFKVYYNGAGKDLAGAISKANTLFKSLGVAPSPYYINKFKGPAVLVEAGFISNASDRQLLQNRSAQIGKEIASGIANYIKP